MYVTNTSREANGMLKMYQPNRLDETRSIIISRDK